MHAHVCVHILDVMWCRVNLQGKTADDLLPVWLQHDVIIYSVTDDQRQSDQATLAIESKTLQVQYMYYSLYRTIHSPTMYQH